MWNISYNSELRLHQK